MKIQKTISIVGAGGKTSLLYTLSHDLQKKGKKVLVTTTTKVYYPTTSANACVVTPSYFNDNNNPWEGHSILFAGDIAPQNPKKLCAPPEPLLHLLAANADYILCEADGSKHHPIKFPAAWEPVLLPDTDIGIVVMGLSALHQPLSKVCHRSALAAAHLHISEHQLVSKEDLLILCSIYLQELQYHKIPSVSFLFNQYQNHSHAEAFRYLRENLIKKGAASVDSANLAAPDIL